MRTTTSYRRVRGPRGAVLITAMWIAIALTAVVLVLCREMLVESMTTHQHLSQAKVDAAEQGVEQYVLSVLEQEIATPGYRDSVLWEQREIGVDLAIPQSGCYFWVLGVNTLDESQFAFGLVDEASKMDLNTSTGDMLSYLPGLDSDYNIAQAILDWRDLDMDESYSSATGGQGAESTYYEGLDPAYRSKDLPFESAEELRLVYGVTDELMWGADLNRNNRIDPEEQNNANLSMSFGVTMRGLASHVTTYGLRATTLSAIQLQATVDNIDAGSPPTVLDASGNEVVLVDINNANTLSDTSLTGNSLQSLLQQYSPTLASQIVTATQNRIAPQNNQQQQQQTTTQPQPFKSLAEWMVVMAQNAQATSNDLYQIYPYLVCYAPATPTNSTANTDTTVTPAAGTSGTSSTTTSQILIEGVMVTETVAEDTETGDYVATCYPAGMLNINTATKAVLMALPMFEEADADAIISYRDSLGIQESFDIPNITWLLDCEIDLEKLAAAAPYITGSSTVFSADIVTVARDGRAFKRVKIVVDTSTGTPQIIYRRDMTDLGWPLDSAVRQALREGLDPSTVTGSGALGLGGMR